MKKLSSLFVAVAIFFTVAGFTGCKVTATTRPADVVVVRPPQPGPNYVWISGDWLWEHSAWKWHEGYWAEPRPHHVWVGGGWYHRGRGWGWHPGHWR